MSGPALEWRPAVRPPRLRAPAWLIVATLALTLLILYMAVAETTLWGHFLVDRGELVSLAGLAFILIAGLLLHRRGRLFASLPLIVPWVVYPVVTQGDQLIDNLNIDQMRAISHAILAILFGAPVAAIGVAAVALLSPQPGAPHRPRRWTVLMPGLRLIERGRVREGVHLLALSLLLVEIWLAHRYLGTLMIVTLAVASVGLLFSATAAVLRPVGRTASNQELRRKLGLAVLLISVAGSFALFLGFKNRPGAYQGSPHHLHDSSRADAFYPIDRVAVPGGHSAAPTSAVADELRIVFDGYRGALEKLFRAYHLLDRNYNYAFHNALFLRNTPVVPDFRRLGIERVRSAEAQAKEAGRRAEAIAGQLPADGVLLAFLDDVRGYVEYNLGRAATLEEMTGRFERTQAGLQHATHLYEGEGKILGERLVALTAKHRAVSEGPETAAIVGSFVTTAERIRAAYANRIVGF